MQLVKLITHKRINTLRRLFVAIFVFFVSMFSPAFSQDNSPYSRYGIGDLVPPTNILTRGMGGISAAYSDFLSINFNNPASYAGFQSFKELNSKKLSSGRAILDIGLNVQNRTLTEPATVKKFTVSDALFSYVQLGVPLKKNWGLSFGLRPISKISYKIFNTERLKDPRTGLPIDSAITVYEGKGGAYLVNVGTGFNLFSRNKNIGKGDKKGLAEEKLSIGFTGGYLFGEKDYSTRRSFINDTVAYNQANFETKTNFNNFFVTAGIQYKIPLSKLVSLTLGAYGNLGQSMDASRDVYRETFFYDASQGNMRLDSIYDSKNEKGKIEVPASYTFGFVLQKLAIINKEGGWILGVDYKQQDWSKYRFYGQTDQLTNKWELRVGGQFNPTPKRNYFSNVTYRAGFFTGPDYVNVGQKLTQTGASFGLGLPLGFSRQAPNQVTLINLALEFSKRGNNDNILKENIFRFSLGFSLSDLWFGKKKYD